MLIRFDTLMHSFVAGTCSDTVTCGDVLMLFIQLLKNLKKLCAFFSE
jgi:hypothetical protein